MDPEQIRDLCLQDKFRNCFYKLTQSGVYYGNACNECFKSDQLKKCASCKIVSYCSKEHQVMDWSTHKNFCSAFKTANERIKDISPHCSFEEFTEYRKALAVELENSDKLFLLAEFEKEVCEFPWVCSVCYSKENLNFPCKECNSIVYCSLEHKKEGEEGHKPFCKRLKLCRLFDSMIYSNGFKLRMPKFVFEEIPRYVKYFPKTMNELSCLIQKQVSKPTHIQDIMNYYIHNDIYSPAATILYAFESIGLLHKREISGKPPLKKREREMRLADRVAQYLAYELHVVGSLNMDAPMTIHFVAADDYEVNCNWTGIIGLLTHWMFNIDYITSVLVGPALENCSPPDFSALKARSDFQFYPTSYKSIVKNLGKPDLVVLFDYGHKKSSSEFNDHHSRRALFKHKRVPLLITSTKKDTLSNFVAKLLDLPNVQVQVDTHVNPFAESRRRRIWDNKFMSTYVINEYIAILTRH